MRFHRTLRKTTLTLLALAGFVALAAPAHATHLAPFIDLQEKGLNLAAAGAGMFNWHGSPRNLTVNIGGPVRFALLYWAGRERPCTFTSSNDCGGVTEPFKDQQMTFNGNPLTGTLIGTETQPVSGGGPILNIGYYADVTSIVAAAGTGSKTFTFGDGNAASNLWRNDGVGLLVGWIDPSDTKTYRVIIWDGLDSAFGPDPTPGETRVTAPVDFNHGINFSDRPAVLWLLMGDGTGDRPDYVTISNNPTVYNLLDGSDGPQWDTQSFDITIPSGVGITSVQAFSAPNNQNPDSLLWEVAALRVQQLDSALPTCPVKFAAGPPAQATVTLKDVGTGLASVVVTMSENADTPVPPFTAGTTDPLVVTSTKIDQASRSRVEMVVSDLAGNKRVCDPIATMVTKSEGKPEDQTFTDVPQAENKVTIINGVEGLKKVTLIVNGTKFKEKDLKDGETATMDISSAMKPGLNKVTIRGNGRKGAWADIFIADTVSE
jgi:hypothetical protein